MRNAPNSTGRRNDPAFDESIARPVPISVLPLANFTGNLSPRSWDLITAYKPVTENDVRKTTLGKYREANDSNLFQEPPFASERSARDRHRPEDTTCALPIEDSDSNLNFFAGFDELGDIVAAPKFKGCLPLFDIAPITGRFAVDIKVVVVIDTGEIQIGGFRVPVVGDG